MRASELNESHLAEFVGVILGDGSIAHYECSDGGGGRKEQHVVKVTLSKDERKYADHVSSLFQTLFDVEPVVYPKSTENTLDIRCFGKEFFTFLIEEIGLVESPKKFRAKVPESFMEREARKNLLRGFFDTDGSLVLTDNNGTLYPRLEIKISDSPMQESIIQILEAEGFRFGVYDCKGHKVRVQLNGKNQLRKWCDKIGFSNYKHLEKLEEVLAGQGFEPWTSGL